MEPAPVSDNLQIVLLFLEKRGCKSLFWGTVIGLIIVEGEAHVKRYRQTMNFCQGTLVLAGLLHSAASWLFLQKRMPNAVSYEIIGFCFVGWS